MVFFLDAAHDATLTAKLGTVGDGDMSDEARLSAHHAVLAEMRRSAHAHLCRQSGVLAYLHIVGQMDKIIQFHAPVDMRRAHRGAVDGGIGPDFHVVVDDHIAHLRDLLVMAVGLRSEAKAVGAEHCTRMEDAVFAHHRVAIELHARIKHCVISDDAAVADIHLRIELHVVADFSVLADKCELTKIQILTALRRGRDESQR